MDHRFYAHSMVLQTTTCTRAGHTGEDAHTTVRRTCPMALGYDGKLYILAFDHRGSFQKKMFGIQGDPTPEETETISDAKRLIIEGMEIAVERGVEADATGVLVDEQFGSDIPRLAKEHGLKLADRKSTRLNSSHGYISYAV